MLIRCYAKKTVVITQWCFSCCWAVLSLSQVFFFFSSDLLLSRHMKLNGDKTSCFRLTKGPFDIGLNSKTGGAGWVESIAWALIDYSWLIVLCITCFPISLCLFIYFLYLNVFIWNYKFSNFCLPPHSAGGGGVCKLCGT